MVAGEVELGVLVGLGLPGVGLLVKPGVGVSVTVGVCVSVGEAIGVVVGVLVGVFGGVDEGVGEAVLVAVGVESSKASLTAKASCGGAPGISGVPQLVVLYPPTYKFELSKASD